MSNIGIDAIVDEAYDFLLQRFATQRRIEAEPNAGGKLRAFSGETVEELTCLIWNALAEKYNINASIETGDTHPVIIVDEYGNSTEEAVDKHCYINRKLILAIEDKTYLDKCYMQRADADFALMKMNPDEQFDAVVLSLEDNIREGTYDFFMHRGNIDHCFILADGKRSGNKEKRIYHNPGRLNRARIVEFVEYVNYPLRVLMNSGEACG